MKCAFVASGGGLRAFAFHIGVLRALEAHGFRRKLAHEPREGQSENTISSYIGSSAGACFSIAATFLETLDEAEHAIGLRAGSGPRIGRRSLFRPSGDWFSAGRKLSGAFSARGIAAFIAKLCGERNDFRTIGPEIYVCATQLNGPRKVIFGPRDSAVARHYDPFIAYYNDISISDAVAASVSVPVMFAPYRIRNPSSGEVFEYIDGEVRETLSVHVARDTDVELAIVSNTWMPTYFKRGVGSISKHGVFAVLNQAISQAIEQKIDRFRYETDRYRETIDAIREFGKWEGLRPEQIENLVGQVCLTLNYRQIDEIYVAPDPYDEDFALIPSFTFDPDKLRRAVHTGFVRAELALAHWRPSSKS
jgi:predicted acylesterase/phospholipase RssA